MQKTIATMTICLLGFSWGQAQLIFPDNNYLSGWVKSGQMHRFLKNDLYGYIDGGAELFHEFGFEELLVQNYQQGEQEISLEAYRMENALAALGIYLMKCGQETPIDGIAARNSGNKYQINIVKGRYFVEVNSFAGDEAILPAAVELAQKLLASIKTGAPISFPEWLPLANLIPGSERLIRGPYSLQTIYTFGEGDIFQLQGQLFGVVANYRDETRRTFSQLIIKYPAPAHAETAYQHVLRNLDPYLNVLEKSTHSLLFKDFQNKFGIISLEDERIIARFKLSEKPILPPK